MKIKLLTLLSLGTMTIGSLTATGLTSCGNKGPEWYALKSDDFLYETRGDTMAATKLQSNINYDSIYINGNIFKEVQWDSFSGFDSIAFDKGPFFGKENNNIKTMEIDFSDCDIDGELYTGLPEGGIIIPTLENSSVNHLIIRPYLNLPDEYYRKFCIPPKNASMGEKFFERFSTNSSNLRIDFYGVISGSRNNFTRVWFGNENYNSIFTRQDGSVAVKNLEIHIPKTENPSEWSKCYLFPENSIIPDLT